MTKTERELFNKIILALFLESHTLPQDQHINQQNSQTLAANQQTGAQTHDGQTQKEEAIHG